MSRKRRLSTLARLLAAISAHDAALLERLASEARVPLDTLVAARDTNAPIEFAAQMRIAAVANTLDGKFASLAHRAYGQAQTALRLEAGAVESHMIYPKARWR